MPTTPGPTITFVDALPDLIHPGEYAGLGDRPVIRMRLIQGADGLEILLDSRHADVLDALLPKLTRGEVEERLCG